VHYLSAENISKSYGITKLFRGISFHISQGDKIGLIARNGTGKSTLLKILAGKDTADEGKIWTHKDAQVILFEQEPEFANSISVLDNIFDSSNPTFQIIKNYESSLESDDVNKLTNAIDAMDESGAWSFEAKVKEILGKLNLHNLNQIMGHLSGGQRKRVALARTLIDAGFEPRHTLLLMDEPTNHLDVQTVEWLENYLNKENITLVLVTHDRYFLDDVCEEIWELDNDILYPYKGNYENYLEKKYARNEADASTLGKAKQEYKKELEWMRKQPRARTTKSKSREDNFYEIEKIAKQRSNEMSLRLEMKMARLGGKVLEMKVVRKAFGDLQLMNGFTYAFKRGERIGVVGKNGIGKSTFLNMIMGLEQPDSGKINLGDTVVIGYYSQKGLQFKEDMRVIEYVKTFAENFPLAKGGSLSATQFLELFLFPAEKQFTYLSMLSGGEKKRLLLLTILFTNPNFLILDEPTNDLDLPTLEVLETFLQQYQGCLLLVSHDRYFMDKLVDHLFVFEGAGVVRDFPGNYSEYRQKLILEEKENKQSKPKNNYIEDNKIAIVSHESIVEQMPKARMGFKEKREWENINAEMESLVKERALITNALQDASLPYEKIKSFSDRLIIIENDLSYKEMRWLELSEMES
jgi:ABC transport system ATP-binding/permease protein